MVEAPPEASLAIRGQTMKAWSLEQTTGIDSLRYVDVELPTPRAGEALIQVTAAALNFSDLLMLQGRYQVKPPFPFSPGQEIAGRVVAVMPGSSLRVGDRIASKVEWGGFADYAIVREVMTIRVPDDLDDAAAATLPVVWPTAWIALHERARLQSGEHVLVLAAAGGVGLASLQLARAAGARTTALVGNRTKFDACRAAGADRVISMEESWVEQVRATGDVDVVVDTVGGEATLQSLRCLGRGGRLLLIGFSSGEIAQVPANRLLLKNASALGVYWSHDWSLAQVQRATDALLDLHARRAIELVPGRRYRFAELPRALGDLARRDTVGKSVLIANGTEGSK